MDEMRAPMPGERPAFVVEDPRSIEFLEAARRVAPTGATVAVARHGISERTLRYKLNQCRRAGALN